MLQKIFPKDLNRFWMSIISILFAFLLGAVLILINGDNPLVVYSVMVEKSFGSIRALAATLAVATPLMLTGLSVAVAFRTGVTNIGSEGQLYIGAIGAAWMGVVLRNLWGPANTILSLIFAIIAGGFFAWVFGWLDVKFNVNVTVTTILATYLAILFTSYLANYPLKPPEAPIGSTQFIEESARLKQLFDFSSFNIGFFIAIGVLILFWLFFRYTSYGYEWKIIGYNKLFAKYLGMNIDRNKNIAMFVSGAFAGLAGAIEVFGVQGRFIQDMSPGYGFDGILVALLAANSAPAIFIVAVLFASLRVGGIGYELITDVPSELGQVIQSIIILMVAGQVGIFQLLKNRKGIFTKAIELFKKKEKNDKYSRDLK